MKNTVYCCTCVRCGHSKPAKEFLPYLEETEKWQVIVRPDTCGTCQPLVEADRRKNPQDNWWLQMLWEEARQRKREAADARKESRKVKLVAKSATKVPSPKAATESFSHAA